VKRHGPLVAGCAALIVYPVVIAPVGLRVPAVCLLLAALGLTQTWIPRRFDALVRFQQPESWLLLARDLVVVALALLLASALRGEDEAPRAQTG
jgi:hypothetical protein